MIFFKAPYKFGNLWRTPTMGSHFPRNLFTLKPRKNFQIGNINKVFLLESNSENNIIAVKGFKWKVRAKNLSQAARESVVTARFNVTSLFPPVLSHSVSLLCASSSRYFPNAEPFIKASESFSEQWLYQKKSSFCRRRCLWWIDRIRIFSVRYFNSNLVIRFSYVKKFLRRNRA